MAEERDWKFRLIEEVQERPLLWDLHDATADPKCDELWHEIGEMLHVEAHKCKQTWIVLHRQFCSFDNEMKESIAQAKRTGSYDPNKKYCSWTYFDKLRFISNGLSSSAKVNLGSENDSSNSGIEFANSDEVQMLVVDRCRLIEEVRKRPELWDAKHERKNFKICRLMWNEVGQVLNTEANVCREEWRNLRKRLTIELGLVEIRIANAKRKGMYDPHEKYWNWTLFDNLRFVVDESKYNLDPENNNDTEINSYREQKYRLIEEVRKRPTLWHKQSVAESSLEKRDSLWTEIGRVLNTEDYICKRTWEKLRTQFRSEMGFIKKRIENAKKNGYYVPHKKYYSWIYFDSLRFIVEGSKYSLSFENDADIQMGENSNADQVKSHLTDNNSSQTESENGIEFTENNCSDLWRKRESVSLIPAVDDYDKSKAKDSNFQIVCVVKEEREFQIEEEACSESFNVFMTAKEDEGNELKEFVSCQTGANYVKDDDRHAPSTFPEEYISSSSDLNDEDYAFLCSFLSQTKIMTQLQKMEFRVNMHKLLADTSPASASINIFEKQLLLPKTNDADKKFLISLWPFVKSMSITQNLQFRVKTAEVLFQILCSETSQ